MLLNTYGFSITKVVKNLRKDNKIQSGGRILVLTGFHGDLSDGKRTTVVDDKSLGDSTMAMEGKV